MNLDPSQPEAAQTWGTRFVVGLLVVFAVFQADALRAHEVRPAYLEIRETARESYTILWKQPVIGELAVRLIPHLSGGALEGRPQKVTVTPRFAIRTWVVDTSKEPLAGQELNIEGLERTITDVLVKLESLGGDVAYERLDAGRPVVTLRFGDNRPRSLAAWLVIGIEHILSGADHLLFVLGLLLLTRSLADLVKTVTAFTLGHSVTLAAAALGMLRMNAPLIEALVALSIIFVAVEIVYVYRGRRTWTAQRAWPMALGFGLLHGAAFAGALAEIGLPRDALVTSLFLFNLGVEAGQLAFIAAVLPLLMLARRLPVATVRRVRWLAPYSIGACAAVWFLERAAVAYNGGA